MSKAQKSINTVCEYRGLPEIKVGQPCTVSGEKGLIINGNRSCNFQVRFSSGEEYNCHPNYKMIIKSMDLKEVIFDSED